MEAIDAAGKISFALNTHTRELVISDNGKAHQRRSIYAVIQPFFSSKRWVGNRPHRDPEILISHGYDFALKTNADGITAF